MASKGERNESEEIDWLYPELLTKEGLICILHQRYIQTVNLEELGKDELLELYYKFILPLPQRKYRQNRRGREMTKKQILMAKKRRIEAPDDNEPPKKKQGLNITESSSRFLTSFSDPSKTSNRLKPPPSCIDSNRKVIKLGSGSKSSSSSQDVSSLSKKIVKISMSPSTETSEKEIVVNKTVKLVNRQSESESKRDPNTVENGDVEMKSDERDETKKSDESKVKDDGPKKKIKLKRISWP